MDLRVRGWEKKTDIYIYLPNSKHHREVGPKLSEFIQSSLLAHFHSDGDFITVRDKYVDVDNELATNFSDFARNYRDNRAGYIELFVFDNTKETKSEKYKHFVQQIWFVYGCERGLTTDEKESQRKLHDEHRDTGELPRTIPMLLENVPVPFMFTRTPLDFTAFDTIKSASDPLLGLYQTLKLYREAIKLDNEQLEQQQHKYVNTLRLGYNSDEPDMLNKHLYDIPGFVTKRLWNVLVDSYLNSSDNPCVHRSIIQYGNNKKITLLALGEKITCDLCKVTYEGGEIKKPVKQPDRIEAEDARNLYYNIRSLFVKEACISRNVRELLQLDEKAKQYTLDSISPYFNVNEWAKWMQKPDARVSICLKCFRKDKSLIFISNDHHNINGCYFCMKDITEECLEHSPFIPGFLQIYKYENTKKYK